MALAPFPGARLKAHIDVFKDGPGGRTLVSTSRPCAKCGQPLDKGFVVAVNRTEQVHAECARG